MTSGSFQSCFPSACMQVSEVGAYTTQGGALEAGALKDMQTEWFPAAAGSCSVTYQLTTKQNPITKEWVKDPEGPTVTLNFTYATTGLKAPAEVQSVTYYDIQGCPVSQPSRGVFIQKTTLADGSSIVHKITRK